MFAFEQMKGADDVAELWSTADDRPLGSLPCSTRSSNIEYLALPRRRMGVVALAVSRPPVAIATVQKAIDVPSQHIQPVKSGPLRPERVTQLERYSLERAKLLDTTEIPARLRLLDMSPSGQLALTGKPDGGGGRLVRLDIWHCGKRHLLGWYPRPLDRLIDPEMIQCAAFGHDNVHVLTYSADQRLTV